MVWSPQVRRSARSGWRRALGCWSSAGGRVFGVRRQPGPAEHGAGVRARSEDVLHGRRQGAGGGAAGGCDGVRDCSAPSPVWDGEGGADLLIGEAGLSSSTIRRRLAAVSSFYGYLITRGDVGVETQPGPAGFADPAVSAPQGAAGPAAGAGGAPTAAHLGPRRAGRADGGAAH